MSNTFAILDLSNTVTNLILVDVTEPVIFYGNLVTTGNAVSIGFTFNGTNFIDFTGNVVL